MAFFWTLWIFNALMALVPVYFFFVGLNDGSITGRNIGLWVIILFVVALVLGGSLMLKYINQLGIAKILLILAAIPGIFALLFMVITITSKTRWN